MNATPNTLDDYLKALREALRGADPALVQDALYDAEEHIRTMIAERPGASEAEVLADVAGSYGAPDEVADIYRDTEIKITRALKPPPPRPAGSPLAKALAIYTDPSAYGALFYMLLALATGVFYFSWTTTGIGLSLGFAILIIGLPFMVLFIASLRLLMRNVVEDGGLAPERQNALQLPFLGEMSEQLERQTGRPATELRLSIQSITFLIARYAISSEQELRVLSNLEGQRSESILTAIEVHLTRTSLTLLGLDAELSAIPS